MPNFTFTPEALNDLNKIVSYTVNEWGKNQAKTYVQGLQLLASRLAKTPNLGQRRATLGKEILSFPYASHILFYS